MQTPCAPPNPVSPILPKKKRLMSSENQETNNKASNNTEADCAKKAKRDKEVIDVEVVAPIFISEVMR